MRRALPGRQPIAFAPFTTRIEIGDCLKAKIDAFHAHKTQSPVFSIFDAHVEKLGNPELFNLAASVIPGAASMETNLFAGIADD